MSTVDQKRAFNKLKHDLENWRELILLMNSIVKWEKPFYPGCIFGTITVFFSFLWYCDYSLLTLLCLLALKCVIIDFAYPIVSRFIFKPENWTGQQESKFEDICNELCTTKSYLKSYYEVLFTAKEQKSTLFVASISILLICGAYIGSVIDNLLLTYMITLLIGFYPGIKNTQFVGQIKNKFSGMIKSKMDKIRDD